MIYTNTKFCLIQGRIQPVRLGGVDFNNSQVSFRIHYYKRDEVYFITLL